MAGIYIHIPYCRRSCSYCNFHFSTQLSSRSAMLEALRKELCLQRECLGRARIQTLYFGGGTPSLLSVEELSTLFDSLRKHYRLSDLEECTLEANPEDICNEKLYAWQQLGVNRLSIGVQSFHASHLQLLGRSSDSCGLQSVKAAAEAGFTRISIDLIYGISEDMKAWQEDIMCALSSPITHISAYNLTIEPLTVLAHKVAKREYTPPSKDIVSQQLDELCIVSQAAGFVQYEVSSFAVPGKESLHNSSYWQDVKYLGIGPSAASYNGRIRWQNVSHNTQYIRFLQQGHLPISQSEQLSKEMRWYELLISGLRTQAGFSLLRARKLLSASNYSLFLEKATALCEAGFLQKRNDLLSPTPKGIKVADEIALRLLSQ